jgi:hypothetical protein
LQSKEFQLISAKPCECCACQSLPSNQKSSSKLVALVCFSETTTISLGVDGGEQLTCSAPRRSTLWNWNLSANNSAKYCKLCELSEV